MQYPLISEYIVAILNAEDNFDKLSNLRPILDDDGNPIMSSGNFAVVFKMEDTNNGRFYALKCFTREQDGRNEAYRQISEEFRKGELTCLREGGGKPYLVDVEYLDKELFVDSANSEESEFPVVLMDWVDGVNIDQYIQEHKDDCFAMHYLFGSFWKLGYWLVRSPIAHGDLKPDNILVREDGSLVLVDYDGMYVPSMKGQKARELGSPDFRHPNRTIEDFDDSIDLFSIATIALSLAVAAVLSETHGIIVSDLFLTQNDYLNSESDKLKSYLNNKKIVPYVPYLFKDSLSYDCRRIAEGLELWMLVPTDIWKEHFFFCDSMKYDFIGRRLLELAGGISNIREGVEIIDSQVTCNPYYCGDYEVILPSSLVEIKENAFTDEVSRIVNHSNHFITDDYGLYTANGKRLITCINHDNKSILHLKDTTCQIDYLDVYEREYPFVEKGGKFYRMNKNITNQILWETHTIDPIFEDIYGAVYSYDKKKMLHFPINFHFPISQGITEYSIQEGCEEISEYAFKHSIGYVFDSKEIHEMVFGNNIEHLHFPSSLRKIGCNGLLGCQKIRNIFIDINNEEKVHALLRSYIQTEEYYEYREIALDNSILVYETNYSDEEFQNGVVDDFGVRYSADGLKLLEGNNISPYYMVKEGTKIICNDAFYLCDVPFLILPESLMSIGEYAFCNCNFEHITIPRNVIQIGSCAFGGSGLIFIKIDGCIKYMGREVFSPCDSDSELKYIELGNSVEDLGEQTFRGCIRFEEITIPESIKHVGSDLFVGSGIKRIINKSSYFKEKYGNLPQYSDAKEEVSDVPYDFPF